MDWMDKIKSALGLGETADKLDKYFTWTFYFQAAIVAMLGWIVWKKC